MRLLLVNPNTSAEITDLALRHARAFAPPDTVIDPVTARFGPRYIGTRAACAIAAHAAIDAVAAALRPYHDGVLLACFGDPGIEAVREVSPVPATGLAEAAMRVALARGARRVGIVTGGARWVPMLTEFVAVLGLGDRLAGVRAVDATGARIAAAPEAAIGALAVEIAAAADEDGAETVILGGAGLAGMVPALQPRLRIPLLDSVACGVSHLADLVRATGGTSKDRTALPAVDSVGLTPALAATLGGG
jgi:Asp/Glu/hydantoin racemase